MSSHEVTTIATVTGLLLVGLAAAAGLLQPPGSRIRPMVETTVIGLVLSTGSWLEHCSPGGSCILVVALLSLVAAWRWISPVSRHRSAGISEPPDVVAGGSRRVTEPGPARPRADGAGQ